MRRCLLFIAIGCLLSSGCGFFPSRAANSVGPEGAIGPFVDNPLFVPPIDREFMWQQLVDVTDDYFKIEREDRVRSINGVLTEGRIDTKPQPASTYLEPWRKDSTPGYEKFHSTLQSLRRRAVIRVIPNEAGYLVDVTVHKELEDMDKPEHATAGGAAVRHDGTLVRNSGPSGRYSITLGWIPLGRDTTLEQRMLADIRARLETVADLGTSREVGSVFSGTPNPGRVESAPVESQKQLEEVPAGRRLPPP